MIINIFLNTSKVFYFSQELKFKKRKMYTGSFEPRVGVPALNLIKNLPSTFHKILLILIWNEICQNESLGDILANSILFSLSMFLSFSSSPPHLLSRLRQTHVSSRTLRHLNEVLMSPEVSRDTDHTVQHLARKLQLPLASIRLALILSPPLLFLLLLLFLLPTILISFSRKESFKWLKYSIENLANLARACIVSYTCSSRSIIGRDPKILVVFWQSSNLCGDFQLSK